MNRKGLLTILLVFGFLFSVFFLFVLLVVGSGSRDFDAHQVGIGVVEVNGAIMESKTAVEQIESFERSENIKGIIVRINSPGGAVSPSQEIHRAVLRARDKKKVVVSMGSLAASGGYYIACAGDRIFANPGTVTGSIGVVTQLTNFSELADLAKIRVHTVTSGDYKDSGNPFRAFSEEDEAFFKQMVMNIHEQFVRDISKSRDLKIDEVRELADGRIYTGEQAKDNGLVDELGGLRDAVDYLAKEVGLGTDPDLIYPKPKDEEFLQRFLKMTAEGVVKGVYQGVRNQSAPSVEYRYTGPN
jgi:protease-4